MKELKTLDLKEISFTANNKKYTIESQLSIQRSVYAEAAKIELEAGLQVGKQLDDWKKIYELANQTKFADIVVMAYNNMRGFKNFFENHPPILKLCACFINHENEDRRVITDEMVKAKIEDWSEEGISMQSFFAIALAFLKADTESYKKATEDISRLIQKFNDQAKAEKFNTHISS